MTLSIIAKDPDDTWEGKVATSADKTELHQAPCTYEDGCRDWLVWESGWKMQDAAGKPRESLRGWTGTTGCTNTAGHMLAALPKLPGAGGDPRRPEARQTCSWESAETLWGWLHGGVRSRTPAVILLLLLMLGRLWPGHAVPSGPCPAGHGAAGEQPEDNGQKDEEMPDPHL